MGEGMAAAFGRPPRVAREARPRALHSEAPLATPGDECKNLRMKAARAAAGFSQADLAQAVGATRQTIGLIEAGGYNPTLKLCLAICHALGCTLDDLFWEEEGQPCA